MNGGGAPGESPARAITVSMLAAQAKAVLEGAFPPLWVSGEVSNFTRHVSGHWYFTLKDARAALPCVVWASDQARIPAPPDEGMQVVALGQLRLWPARGRVQFAIRAMEAEGEGLWRKAFERTRAALERDGLLDPRRKRALPRYPRRVAVVTSVDGAALHDIVSVIRRRNAAVEIVVAGAAVQGDAAPASLVAALERVARWNDADVVIVGRGGGSREDLWAFNDERVARAIAACPIPTISAVGHEVDTTIADLVADVRAPTPSAAAETAVPVLEDVKNGLRLLATAMRDPLRVRLATAGDEVRRIARDVALLAERAVERRRAALQATAARLESLSPLGTLARGYAIARSAEGAPLARAAAFVPGGPFELVLHDGRVDAHSDSVHVRASP